DGRSPRCAPHRSLTRARRMRDGFRRARTGLGTGRSGAGHAFGPDRPFLRGDAELGVRGAVASIAAAPLDDLEEEAFAEGAAVELEIFSAIGVAVVKDVVLPQPVGEAGVEPEPRLQIVIVVGADLQRREAEGGEAAG